MTVRELKFVSMRLVADDASRIAEGATSDEVKHLARVVVKLAGLLQEQARELEEAREENARLHGKAY